MDLTAMVADSLKLQVLPDVDVTGFASDSFMGILLIAIVIGNFLILFIGGFIGMRKYYHWKKDRATDKQDRAIKESNQCQIHSDEINNLKSDVNEMKSEIKEGFQTIHAEIKTTHARIDQIFVLASTNGFNKNQPYSRKG